MARGINGEPFRHCHKSDGTPKLTYPTRPQAKKAARFIAKTLKKRMRIYPCKTHDGYHLAKLPAT